MSTQAATPNNPPKQLDILHIIHRYYPEIGGAETYLRKLSTYLADQGHRVTVVTSDAGDFDRFWHPNARRIAETDTVDGSVKIKRFPIDHLPLSRLAFPALRRLQYLASKSERIPLDRLRGLIELTPRMPALWDWVATTEQRFDVVAAMGVLLEPFPLAGQQLAKRIGSPFAIYPLAHFGASSTPGSDKISRYFTMRQQNSIVTNADYVLAQTEYERDYYVERGLSAEKSSVVGPGIELTDGQRGDADHFRHRHAIPGKMVLSVSRLSADKGTTTTIAACCRLWQTGHQFTLVLIGQVGKEVAQQLATLTSAERQHIRILGQVPEATKWDAYAAATLFAMPSRTDSFGISYLEAWLYRNPVIAAKAWGISDLVSDAVDGLLIDFGSVPQAITAIGRLLSDDDLTHRLGENGYAKVQQHSWALKCAQVATIYESLVATHNQV